MKRHTIALTFTCLLVIACGEPKHSTTAQETDDSASSKIALSSKQIFRCEYSPLVDYNTMDLIDSLEKMEPWRVVADGVCNDAGVYKNLENEVASLPDYTEMDYPFVGYCEHYLLTNGSAKAILIGFVCENYGIVVWQMEADEDGRWMKTDIGTLRGSEEDKAKIQSIMSNAKFEPL